MFGSFSVINIIVLLNLLIAMMNHSYQLISVSSVSIRLYEQKQRKKSISKHFAILFCFNFFWIFLNIIYTIAFFNYAKLFIQQCQRYEFKIKNFFKISTIQKILQGVHPFNFIIFKLNILSILHFQLIFHNFCMGYIFDTLYFSFSFFPQQNIEHELEY